MRIQKRHCGFQSILARIVLLLVAGCVASMSAAAPVAADVPRAYAGIVVDAKTGRVLYQEEADELRYPASLTKVMTLYIVFQELAAGRLDLDTRLRVSEYAAKAEPMKLWVQPGTTISVESAIKALVTLSANDVARVIAENISGTESQFAARMTATARALGMSRTVYKNANGLPNSGQVTTAADQAILARAVYLHFPNRYEYFQTRSFTYYGKTFGNHNRLLGKNGVDGIKTGYINASGYNLMTAARSNNRHIVAIGLGFDTGAARNAHVAELVRTYMPRARRGDYWREAMIERPTLLDSGSGIHVAAAPAPLDGLPPARPAHLVPSTLIDLGAPIQVASVDRTAPRMPPDPQEVPFQVISADDIPARPGGSALEQATYVATGVPPGEQNAYPDDDPIGAWIAETLKLGPMTNDAGQIVAPSPIARPDGLTVDPVVTNSADTVVARGWIIQVGAAKSKNAAHMLLDQASANHDLLADLRSYVETINRNGQTIYRARFAGFANRSQASATCNKLAHMGCLAVHGG